MLPLGAVPSPLLATRPITSSQKSAGLTKEGQRLYLKGAAGLSQQVLAGAWAYVWDCFWGYVIEATKIYGWIRKILLT